MESKPVSDPQGTQTISSDTKQSWEKPFFKEADIAGITQAVGLGNNDGAASHT